MRAALIYFTRFTASCLAAFVVIAARAATEATATHGMVASVNGFATDAGVKVLQGGGNAVDAAVAVGLTLGVVDPHNSGIGGGCFMLIHLADGENVCIDGRETAPARAARDMYVRHGKGDTHLSQTGALASGVPGEIAAFEYAVRHYGKKKFPDLILPAADLAAKGFKLGAGCAKALQSVAREMEPFKASTAVYFRNGSPLKAGEVLRQPDLAATYRNIARDGGNWFYRGPFAQAVENWMQTNGGLLTAADFAHYRAAVREPVQSTYRGYEIISFPPPSSGGVHVLEMLNILENFDLSRLDQATRLHLVAESMKLAFADRAYWLGDPAFARVPRGLLDKTYAAGLAKKINLEHATIVEGHGQPPHWQTDVFKKHTTHFSVADDQGNWVACTATVNTSFGSKVVIPGTGVVLNDEMDDFSVQPGVPNAFGLIGGEANAVAPGKRPLSSMSPTIVCKDGQPVIALGAAGGPRIITAVLQELVNMLDLGLTPAQALAAPRIHQQWSPDELVVEARLPESLKKDLARLGHKIKEINSSAVSQIVARSPDGKAFIGAADPRADGAAAGW